MNLEFYKNQLDTKYERNFFYNFSEIFPELFVNHMLKYVLLNNDDQFTFNLRDFFICKDYDDEIKVYYSNESSVYIPFIKLENLDNLKKLNVGLEMIKCQILNIPITAIFGEGFDK